MIAVGSKGYQLNISKIAYQFNGAVSMEYLQNCSFERINELVNHIEIIAKEVNSGK